MPPNASTVMSNSLSFKSLSFYLGTTATKLGTSSTEVDSVFREGAIQEVAGRGRSR